MRILVMLCCNHYRNGVFNGRLCGVDFGHELLEVVCSDLRGDRMRYSWSEMTQGSGKIHLKGHKEFCFSGHREWVGNWCWDGVMMSLTEAARLANHLKTLHWWHCDAAEESMYEKWNDKGYQFKPEDFREQENSAAEGVQPLEEPKDALEQMGM